MRINPQKKLRDNFFYNNLCIIICIFCIVSFVTSISYKNSSITTYNYNSLQEGTIIGPINVKNKNAIYKITIKFLAENAAVYFSGEVLDKNKDTIYEFGKDLWHESGHDSEGYWSESDRKMTVNLTFSEQGKYYLQFRTEEKLINHITITIELQKGSYIPHFAAGTLFFILIIIWGYILNKTWIKEKTEVLYEIMDE